MVFQCDCPWSCPAEVLSRFWNHNQPKTRWAPVSWLLPLPPFGAVSLDFCLRARTCSEQFSCFVLFLPCWPDRKASIEGSQPSLLRRGVGLPGLEVAGMLISHESSWVYQERKHKDVLVFFVFFWGRGSQVLLRLLTRQALSQPTDGFSCCPGCWLDVSESSKGALQARVGGWASSPPQHWPGPWWAGGSFLCSSQPLPQHPALLLPLIGIPLCSN